MSHDIFIYGTLREGYPNHRHNLGERTAGTFQTVERFPLVLNGERCSPCLVNLPGEGFRVRGELYRVDDAGLALMDRLERTDAADGYRRLEIQIKPDDPSLPGEMTVFAYLLAAEFVRDIRQGPLPEYTPAHASRYRPRDSGSNRGAAGAISHGTG